MKTVRHTRIVVLLLVSGLLATLLSACGGTGTGKTSGSQSAPGAKASPVEITFANWISVEEQTKGIYAELISRFEAEHPNIKVKTIGMPFNQIKDQMLIMSSGGNAPDIALVNSQMAPTFVAANDLEPLDGVLPRTVIDDLVEGNRHGGTYGGKLMAYPWAPHPHALFWSKVLFQKVGLDPEKPPKTWDEMDQMARKIAALKKDAQGNPIYGFGDASSKVAYTGVTFLRNLYSFGGMYADESGKVLLDNPATTATLAWYRSLAVDGIMPEGLDVKDVRQLFAHDQIGFLIDGDFSRGVFRIMSGNGAQFDSHWGLAVIPPNKTGRSESVFTEHQLVIFKGAKHQKEAAELLQWLVDKEAMAMYHAAIGTMSARKSIAALTEMNQDAYDKMFNEQQKTASPLPANNPKFDNAMEELATAVQMVVVAKDDPAKAAKYGVDKVTALYRSK